MFISQQALTFLWNFTTYVQSIVIDICKVLRYRTSLMVLFSSSTLSSTSSRISQRTEFVSVIKINHGWVLSYMYVGLHVIILLFVSDYSRGRNIGTNFGKYSKLEIQPHNYYSNKMHTFIIKSIRYHNLYFMSLYFAPTCV
jgi:hypothetical protein